MFKVCEYEFPLGKKTYIMGILNYTPDSFSDGGLHNTPEKALKHALLMQSQGADIIDIGCNSTRPGSIVLTAEEELVRLREVLQAVKGKLDAAVSVDTFYVECAEYALMNGASIINDVSGTFNKEIAKLVKKYNAGYIVMHNPCWAEKEAAYPDGAVADVRAFFEMCINEADKIGLKKSQLCLDPGYGFSKSESDNYELLTHTSELKYEGYALLTGLSRKRFIRNGKNNEVDFATAAANTIAIMGGTDIIRDHNVSASVAVCRVADASKSE